jgi:hypothetical protein
VRARYSDRGRWQQFVLCPYGCPVSSDESSSLCDGDVVSLLAHNNCYLGVQDTQVSASWEVVEDACAFVVRTQGNEELRHRSPVFLQSCATSRVLAPNESDPKARDRLLARWMDFGNWQKFVIEKPLSTAVTPRRPRRRSSFPGQGDLSHLGTPRSARRSSIGSDFKESRRCSTPAAETPAASRAVETPATSRALRRRSSVASSGDPAQAVAPRTPLRRRASIAAVVTPNTAPLPESIPIVAVATPSKRCHSPSADLLQVPTPSRRRLSTKSSAADLFGTPTRPTPKDLDVVFEER